MTYRDYNPDRDRDAIRRIWRETGWLSPTGSGEGQDLFLSIGRAFVTELDGEAECLVATGPGHVRHLQDDVPFCCVHGVTTSRIARQQGLASRLTAAAIAANVADGSQVAGLGIFDQGFYNRLGFGSGAYDHRVSLDPARLLVDRRPRVPKRLTADDFEAMHASRLARRRDHGSCNITAPSFTRSEVVERDSAFGLGYFDGPSGELTHHLWCKPESVENGPYEVVWMAFQTGDQFLELMALLKGLGDQVKLIQIGEPPGIQMQDLIDRPFREYQAREGGKFATGIDAYAWWQMRICDVPGCLARTHLPGRTVRFNLRLSDPIERYLPDDAPWRGVGGEYVITLGPESAASSGHNPALPTLEASVNAFTRLWLGVRPATGLSITDDFAAPPDLLTALDETLQLPPPKPDWPF